MAREYNLPLIMLRARYRRIVLFFARILIGIAFWDILLPHIGFRKLTLRTRPERLRRSAAAFRILAVRMGGVLIKVGQFLSTRVDVLPQEFTHELEGLQDEVPPEKFSDIRRVIEAEFGAPLEEKFAAFEEEPLAAASLGQVHRAWLYKNNANALAGAANLQPAAEAETKNVVVKVQRPNIEMLIRTDLAALNTVGVWLNRYRPIRRRANVPALLAEFTRILYEEIDYLAEGRNAETFSANFKEYPAVRVPSVVWTHTTRRALTLEDVWAIKISDYQAITDAGISRAEVASRLLNTYLKQIFEDSFFHADPHPGNLFVNPLPGPVDAEGNRATGWELTFVDFGMVGRVPPNLRTGLRELLIGVGTRDAARVVKAYKDLDVLLPGADLSLIEQAESRVFDQFWGKNMAELTSFSIEEMREFANEFRELLYDMPFQVPQNIIFLARCVGILSGMCTGLDPQFNVWEHLSPYARRIMAEEARAGRETWLAELGNLARSLVVVPQKMDSILSKIERGEVAVRSPEISQQVQRLEGGFQRVTGAILFGAFLLGGIQLYIGGELAPALVLFGLAGLNLLWLLFRSARRGL